MLQPLLLRLFGIGINLSVSRTASVVASDWGVWGEVEDFTFYMAPHWHLHSHETTLHTSHAYQAAADASMDSKAPCASPCAYCGYFEQWGSSSCW